MRRHTETAVLITAKFYEARDAMKFLFRDRFKEQCVEYQDYIKRYAAANSLNELKSTMALLKKLQDSDVDNGVSQALLLAAYAELIEPTV